MIWMFVSEQGPRKGSDLAILQNWKQITSTYIALPGTGEILKLTTKGAAINLKEEEEKFTALWWIIYCIWSPLTSLFRK